MCTRCGLNVIETEFHRYYACPANDLITDEEVTTTQHLHKEVAKDDAHQCMWFRGIMPGGKIGKPVGWLSEADCNAHTFGDIVGILEKNRVAGTDGGGDGEKDARSQDQVLQPGHQRGPMDEDLPCGENKEHQLR